MEVTNLTTQDGRASELLSRVQDGGAVKERRVKGRVDIARNIDLATDIDEKGEGQKTSDDQVSHASDEGVVETGIEDQEEEDV